MLFDGPWLAERFASVGKFVQRRQADVLPTTLGIIENGTHWNGVQVFEAMMRINETKAFVRRKVGPSGVLAVPTVAPLYTIAEMRADPVRLNTHHGHYSYFANVLDLCAVSVPTGFYSNGMPFGITLMAPAFRDAAVAGLAKAITDLAAAPLGRTRTP